MIRLPKKQFVELFVEGQILRFPKKPFVELFVKGQRIRLSKANDKIA